MRASILLVAAATSGTGMLAHASSSTWATWQPATTTITKTLLHVTGTTTMTSYPNTASMGFQNLTTTATSYSHNPTSLTAVASSASPSTSAYQANDAGALTINVVGAAIAGIAAIGLGVL